MQRSGPGTSEDRTPKPKTEDGEWCAQGCSAAAGRTAVVALVEVGTRRGIWFSSVVNYEDVSERHYQGRKTSRTFPWGNPHGDCSFSCCHHVFHFIVTAEKETSVFYLLLGYFRQCLAGRHSWRQLCQWFWDRASVCQQIKSVTNAILKTSCRIWTSDQQLSTKLISLWNWSLSAFRL